jgi:hypothetical protein
MRPIAASMPPVLSMPIATMAADTTVIGPVGPEACVAVPPSAAAKTPIAIAP